MSVTFDLLHSLRVKGLAKPEVLSDLSGVPSAELEAACAPLVEDGLVMLRGGAVGGYMLTPTGREEAVRLLVDDDETTAAAGALADFDEAFLPHNTEFKKICHRWQMRNDDEPNDHTDAEYDAAVIGELSEFHTGFLPVLETIEGPLPRFGRYRDRLEVALRRVLSGDATAFARPMADSYHDIWMELHNDVVLSLRRERTSADES